MNKRLKELEADHRDVSITAHINNIVCNVLRNFQGFVIATEHSCQMLSRR